MCPYQAHIRKTNPRGDLAAFVRDQTDDVERACASCGAASRSASVRTLRPARRSRRPETGVGLLFMCYSARLIQFVIQQEGADGNDFVKPGVGPDAMLGNNTTRLAQQWPLNGNPAAKSFPDVEFHHHARRRVFLRAEPVVSQVVTLANSLRHSGAARTSLGGD